MLREFDGVALTLGATGSRAPSFGSSWAEDDLVVAAIIAAIHHTWVEFCVVLVIRVGRGTCSLECQS